MRKGSILSLCLVLVFLLGEIFPSINYAYAKSEVKRQIIVFEKDVGSEKKTQILDKHKATKLKDIKGTNAVVVYMSTDNDIASEEDVRYVEDDYVVSIDGGSSQKSGKQDVPLPEQPVETVPWGIEYMNDLVSGEVNTYCSIKVGIIDTGIDVDHPDLVDNIKGGYNVISNKKSYNDDNGHGTHVAGIIAAVDNEIGVIGVAPEANLYAVKALDSSGNGYISDVIEGIEWCIANDIEIINMSIGMETNSTALYESVVKASNAGIIMVAAAGNNYGGQCEYPAAYNEVIGVGAIDINGNIAEFSAKNGVDVWAPGVKIYSTAIGGGYVEMEGTSMATPHWIFYMVFSKQQI